MRALEVIDVVVDVAYVMTLSNSLYSRPVLLSGYQNTSVPTLWLKTDKA